MIMFILCSIIGAVAGGLIGSLVNCVSVGVVLGLLVAWAIFAVLKLGRAALGSLADSGDFDFGDFID